MNYFEFERNLYSNEKTAMDDALAEAAAQAAKLARSVIPDAPHHQKSSAKVVAQYSKKDHILSAEELMEHRKHCRAKPGNCPFEKAKDEADEITPNEIKVPKQNVYNRLAAVLTQMFLVAKNLSKAAIADPEAVEEKADPATPPSEKPIADDPTGGASPQKIAQDEAPQGPDEPNTDAKIVAEILEGGIEKMVELAKGKGCMVTMDEKKSKYIVKGPQGSPLESE